MQTLADLDLPHLPIELPDFGKNPYPYFAAARAQHPWLAKSDFGLIVHEFRAIRELYIMDDKLRPGYDGYVDLLGVRGTPFGRFQEDQMISLPVDQHRVIRETVMGKFTPRYANQLRPLMQQTVVRLLDEWVPKGEFDFEEFASYFPISVMFNVIGAPLDEVPKIRTSLETLGLAQSMNKDLLPAVQEAYLRIENLIFELIAGRRADPELGKRADLMDLLIATGDSGTINERQLVDLLIFLFVAGYDTSKNVLTFTMYLLLQYPDVYARCATDPSYCARVVEEVLRYYNPGTAPRITNEDIVYRNVLLPKDTMLLFTFNISGRDPGTFENPDKFDPDRKIEPNQRHVAFGLGKHICLGQHIARAQISEALHQIAQRIPAPRLGGEVGWRPFPGIWGLKGLPIKFTTAKAA